MIIGWDQTKDGRKRNIIHRNPLIDVLFDREDPLDSFCTVNREKEKNEDGGILLVWEQEKNKKAHNKNGLREVEWVGEEKKKKKKKEKEKEKKMNGEKEEDGNHINKIKIFLHAARTGHGEKKKKY